MRYAIALILVLTACGSEEAPRAPVSGALLPSNFVCQSFSVFTCSRVNACNPNRGLSACIDDLSALCCSTSDTRPDCLRFVATTQASLDACEASYASAACDSVTAGRPPAGCAGVR